MAEHNMLNYKTIKMKHRENFQTHSDLPQRINLDIFKSILSSLLTI